MISEAAQPIISIATPNRSFEGHVIPHIQTPSPDDLSSPTKFDSRENRGFWKSLTRALGKDRKMAPVRMTQDLSATVNAVAVFPDGRRMAAGLRDKTVRLWNLKDGVMLKKMEGHGGVRAMAVSGDGELIASGDVDGKFIVCHTDTSVFLTQPIQAHSDRIYSLDFSPDGAVLVTGSGDGTTRLWSTKTWQVHGNPISCGGQVNCVRYSPSGELAIATSKYVEIWNPRTSESIAKLKVTDVYSLAWTLDGTCLLSGGISGIQEAGIQNTSTWRRIGFPWVSGSSRTKTIYALAVNSTGILVASTSNDKHVRLWRRSDRRIIAMFKHSVGPVLCVAFSKDDKHIFSGGYDKKLSQWAVPEDALLRDAPDVGFPFISVMSSLISPKDTSSKYHDRDIELYSAATGFDSASDTIFANRCREKLGKMLWEDALLDAQKVIELNPSSYIGYQLKNAALHGAQRYDEAIIALHIMLSKLDHFPDTHTRGLRQLYITSSEAASAIQEVIRTHLENLPHRLINTFTGRLCNRGEQITTFKTSREYKELLSSTMECARFQMDDITNAVQMYFRSVMLSHRWEENEPLLRHIQDKDVYKLNLVGGIMKLQPFCKTARDAGYRWAWVDTCCIDHTNNVEVQQSVNSMFVWYRHSALTIVYLSDVPPSSKSGALAKSVWNQRGWTVQEFLAPKFVLFYQSDWTLYLNDRSPNHKGSVVIMRELADATGIDPQALVAFRPGMRGAREKLQWVSTRITTLQEDIAYSLFGIFGVHLPVIYGENKQNALGRLLQEIIAKSGDITCLDWVGKPSEFNSCLPANITSYGADPSMLSSQLSEGEMQRSVSSLRDTVDAELPLRLYQTFESLNTPQFIASRLRLPCIAFAVTSIRRRRGDGEDQQLASTFLVKTDGLRDLSITTEDKLIQFSGAMPIRQAILLVRPWDYSLLELPDPADLPYLSDSENEEDLPPPASPLRDSPVGSLRENGLLDSETYSRALRLMVRLGEPFSAFLLAQQPGGGYKRIASDQSIIAQVEDMTAVDDMMDVRTLEIL